MTDQPIIEPIPQRNFKPIVEESAPAPKQIANETEVEIPPRKSTSKGSNKFIFLLIFLVFFIIVVIVLLLISSQTENKPLPPKPTITPTPTSTGSTTTEENPIYSDWNTYISEENDFIFKYPQNWETISTVPIEYEDKMIGMSETTCDLLLQDMDNRTNIIAIDLVNFGQNTLCWSYGDYEEDYSRPINTSVLSGQIKVYKWSYPEEVTTLQEKAYFLQKVTLNKYKLEIALIFESKEDSSIQDTFDLILSSFKSKKDAVSYEPQIPAGWTIKTDTDCLVNFPQPPKEEPYYDIENSTYWIFERQENPLWEIFALSRRQIYKNPGQAGSGQVLGAVEVYCANNVDLLDNNELLDKIKEEFGSSEESPVLKIYQETIKWGHGVLVANIQGGTEGNENYYFFTTDNMVYAIKKIVESTDEFVETTTDNIFENLEFKIE